jgi:hypothetical protein
VEVLLDAIEVNRCMVSFYLYFKVGGAIRGISDNRNFSKVKTYLVHNQLE